MNKSGVVEIHGREYETVALRVQKFRAKYPAYTLQTKVVRLDQDEVLIEACISDEQGRLIANGHAQEFRQSSAINKTSYVENCETSAIGRALAAFGLGGSEFASADEVANAITNKKPPESGANGAQVCKDEFNAMPAEEQKFLQETAANVTALLDEKRDDEAYNLLHTLDNEEKVAIWSLFSSKQRSALKKIGDGKKTYMDEKAAA